MEMKLKLGVIQVRVWVEWFYMEMLKVHVMGFSLEWLVGESSSPTNLAQKESWTSLRYDRNFGESY